MGGWVGGWVGGGSHRVQSLLDCLYLLLLSSFLFLQLGELGLEVAAGFLCGSGWVGRWVGGWVDVYTFLLPFALGRLLLLRRRNLVLLTHPPTHPPTHPTYLPSSSPSRWVASSSSSAAAVSACRRVLTSPTSSIPPSSCWRRESNPPRSSSRSSLFEWVGG